jgi:hypothetical protein
VDLTCFTPAQVRQSVEGLDGQRVMQTGTVWSYGPTAIVPTIEDAPSTLRRAGANELAVEQARSGGAGWVRARVVHPMFPNYEAPATHLHRQFRSPQVLDSMTSAPANLVLMANTSKEAS